MLFSGIGYGFIFGPSMVVVGQYFNKHRSQANGLAVAGGSLGQVVIPFLFVSFVNTFNFQGGTMLYAALALHAIPAAMLLRPLKGRQKVADTIVLTNDNHTEDSRLTWQTGETRSNSNLHTSHESFSNPTSFYNDAGFSQNNPKYEEVSLDKESLIVPSDMNTQSLFDMRDLGFCYSDTKPVVTPASRNCQESMRRCSDPAIEENEQQKRTMQTNFLDNILGYKCYKAKSDVGLPSDNTETDDDFNKLVDYKIDKYQSKKSLEEHSEGTADDELGEFLLMHKEAEYDILDEISRECSIRHSVLQESDDNVTTGDNASESGTRYSEFKNEFSTQQTDEDIVCVADNQPPCLRENFTAELKQSYSDIFKLLETPVPRIDFNIGESSDFNFSVGSLNFDDTDHLKKEKTSSEQNINYDFITNNYNNEGTDDKNGTTQQKEMPIEHKEKSLQRKKKSNKHRKPSKHRKKSSEHKKESIEHRSKTRQQKTRPVQKSLSENMDKSPSFSPENNCNILTHSSEKISSDQQEMVNYTPKADDSRNSVPNYTTQPNLNSDEWPGFLKSNALFSGNNFEFDDSIKTSSANELATLLHEDLDSIPKETSAILKNASLPSNFKHPSFYEYSKLVVNKVLDQRLLNNWSYLLFATGLAFSHSGHMNGCFFLPVFATEMGHSDLAMAVLVSIMGVADFLGRIAGGFCSEQRTFKVTTLLGSFLVICGLLALIMTSYPRLWMLILYGIFHSFLCGAYMSMLVVALVDVVGIDNLASGIGFSTILIGMFMLPTSSILGKILTFLYQYVDYYIAPSTTS